MTITLTRTVEPGRPLWRCAPVLSDGARPVALLDSAMDPDRLGRHSFLAANPPALLTAKRRRGLAGPGQRSPFLITLTTWRRPDGSTPDEPESRTWSGDPFVALRQLQEAYAAPPPARGTPVGPFAGGLVGWLGYELAHALEFLPATARDELGLPDLCLMVADEVLAEDAATGAVTLTVTGRGADPRADAEARLAAWHQALAAPGPAPSPVAGSRGGGPPLRAHFDREAYAAAVSRCREHILAGDVFEVCLTHRLEAEFGGAPWRLYEALRAGTPAPFAAWLDFGDHQVVSASPERFLRLDADGLAESRPIKGTRPRGATAGDDERLRADLQTSVKDRAENIMIVDLVRNDLGRVCATGSVKVPEMLAVETYATVHQLVSTVQGRLATGAHPLDLVRACFPGGSMTGAPKIAAMAIIDAIEPVARGVYSGAIGYFDRSGALDLSIVIRTLVCRDGRASFGVGGAVTADSDPLAEYEETMDKARALIAALNAAAPPAVAGSARPGDGSG